MRRLDRPPPLNNETSPCVTANRDNNNPDNRNNNNGFRLARSLHGNGCSRGDRSGIPTRQRAKSRVCVWIVGKPKFRRSL